MNVSFRGKEDTMKINRKLPINLPCQEHPADCSFKVIESTRGEEITDIKNKEVNYLVFFLSGKAKISSNLFDEVLFNEGDIFFLPRMSECQIKILDETKTLVHTFSHSSCNSTRCILSHLYFYSQNSANEVSYNCKIKAVPAFQPYAKSVLAFLDDNFNDSSLWYIKHQEAIRILKNYYDRDELRSFLRPMLHESVPFQSLVYTYAKYAHNVEELANLCGYGIVNFRKTFKKQFGIPAFQWLQTEKAKRIRHALTTSELSIKEITHEYDFQSASHFNRFCKQYLGDIPSQIRKTAKLKR